VALNAHSEQPELGSPDDYSAHHPQEHPSEWGWHGEWGRASRIAGWVVAIILLLLITATHYNDAGALALTLGALFLIVALVWDIQRRKNAWRK
jgi:hypothetical protein